MGFCMSRTKKSFKGLKISRVKFPLFEIAINPVIPLANIAQRRFPLIDHYWGCEEGCLGIRDKHEVGTLIIWGTNEKIEDGNRNSKENNYTSYQGIQLSEGESVDPVGQIGQGW
jgi:hypothetical protein